MTSFILVATFVILALGCVLALKGEYPTPPPTFEAKDYTKWDLRKSGKSRRANIDVKFQAADGSDDYISMIRLDLVGTAYERGYAQGQLLNKEIREFIGVQLNKFYAQEVLSLDVSQFPEPLQTVLRVLQLKGAAAAPEVFRLAEAWVWEQEKQYVPAGLIDEMSGMAQAVCDTAGGSGCNVTEWQQTIQATNMLPELIRMACTAFGAWGEATTSKTGLVQLRALDFGGGPFANYTVLAVNHATESGNSFASVTFPGMVGAITGVSQSGVGISEKVWMTYDTPDLLPGSYHGLADVFVLRQILENSKTKEDAIDYLKNIQRTWAIWIGIGDYSSQKFNLVGYQQTSVEVYDDHTMPSMTGAQFIDSVCYVDKHPQPSHSSDLGEALADFRGDISLETTKTIIQFHGTGDLHTAAYDYGSKEMIVNIGRINGKGQYGPEGGDDSMWKAYNRPSLKFNLEDLWAGI